MQALELIKYALDVYKSCLPTTRYALVRCQLLYSAVHAMLALDQPGDAMREVENVLKETQVPTRLVFSCMPLRIACTRDPSPQHHIAIHVPEF